MAGELKETVTAAEKGKEKQKMTLEKRAGHGKTCTSELKAPALSCS